MAKYAVNKDVEWYFNQGVNRPMDKYYIEYDPTTFIPKLKLKINEEKK